MDIGNGQLHCILAEALHRLWPATQLHGCARRRPPSPSLAVDSRSIISITDYKLTINGLPSTHYNTYLHIMAYPYFLARPARYPCPSTVERSTYQTLILACCPPLIEKSLSLPG